MLRLLLETKTNKQNDSFAPLFDTVPLPARFYHLLPFDSDRTCIQNADIKGHCSQISESSQMVYPTEFIDSKTVLKPHFNPSERSIPDETTWPPLVNLRHTLTTNAARWLAVRYKLHNARCYPFRFTMHRLDIKIFLLARLVFLCLHQKAGMRERGVAENKDHSGWAL